MGRFRPIDQIDQNWLPIHLEALASRNSLSDAERELQKQLQEKQAAITVFEDSQRQMNERYRKIRTILSDAEAKELLELEQALAAGTPIGPVSQGLMEFYHERLTEAGVL